MPASELRTPGSGAEAALARLAIDPRLFGLRELDVHHDEAASTLWTFMRPVERPSFTPAMLHDFREWQAGIMASFGSGRQPLRWLVLGSRAPGVFCFGGDLDLFVALIRSGNRDALAGYGRACVEILWRNYHALDLPLLTIGLVQGDALGGGFEALLSFDFIIAERGAKFGLPEVMFGLFPGMGAHALLVRKLGAAMADRLILGNRTWLAEELHDIGLVHQLAEPGEGVAAARAFIRSETRRHAGLYGARRAMRRVMPLGLGELGEIVEDWADTAIALREQDLKIMLRLVAAQRRLAAN